MAIGKSMANMDTMLRELFVEPLLEEMRRDLNRTAYGAGKRYELHYNKCHEHGLEHKWSEGKVLSGGVCTSCDGEGLASGEDTSLWQDCWSCGGRGYTPTRYYRQCERCGFGHIRPGYGLI